MKKISILFALALGVLVSSCDKSAKEVTLKSEKDSLSYAYGVGYGSYILNNHLKGDSAGVNYDALLKGLKEGLKENDTTINYYAIGLSLGSTLKADVEKGLMQDSSLTLDMDVLKNALFASIAKKDTKISVEEANTILQTTVERKQKAEMEKQFGGNKAQGEKFLAENKTKEGVVTLASGLQYKVVKEGKGTKPSATDKVKVHYEGKLINGEVFDSSIKRGQAAEFLVNQVIPGWTEALQLMPVGSKWQIYIPQNLAYGERDMQTIPPFSTLVFDVELISIVK